jgi:hypothetical protein
MINTLVSLTDSSPQNQNSLRIMLCSAWCAMDNLVDVHVLIPNECNCEELRSWLDNYSVNLHSYNLKPNGDPYQVKFLLSSFLREVHHSNSFLYIDPDHLVLAPPPLEEIRCGLHVSSEFKVMDTPPVCVPEASGKFIHYNTSLIYGNIDIWRSVLPLWKSIYDESVNTIHWRNREEIAFSMAALGAGVRLNPVSPSIQSGFKNIDRLSALFHYGGDTCESKKLKECLMNRSETQQRLAMLVKNNLNTPSSWIANRMLAHLEEALT